MKKNRKLLSQFHGLNWIHLRFIIIHWLSQFFIMINKFNIHFDDGKLICVFNQNNFKSRCLAYLPTHTHRTNIENLKNYEYS